ncbi:unnamed protein product [Polarella glacialis]|uniref:Uncharacterized protein n=1 Tax=Polarella glacialis TaxID=89957 RepID=A0A813LF10_POLGL|nr:unnamed protein product [Polarella glacialis]
MLRLGASVSPMIVIAADDSSKGEMMSYASMQKACNMWADDRIIGRGAAAVVYRAELPRFGAVAVKRFTEGADRCPLLCVAVVVLVEYCCCWCCCC